VAAAAETVAESAGAAFAAGWVATGGWLRAI